MGTNNIKKSEKLKDKFTVLIDSLVAQGKQLIISSPPPLPCFDDVKLRCLGKLWLEDQYRNTDIQYMGNFSAFFKPQ